jgi:dTDP-4-amino-4,6-dideoxygalactose transaminase
MPEPMVPMADLKAQYARIREEIDAAIAGVVESTQFVRGKDCTAFEEEFAAYCGTAYACGVANGTDALTLSLWALGIKEGDEVVTVANTFIATGEAILINGARPVFVDVDADTFTMDPASLRKAITTRTKAILPVHLYGHPADMTPILDIAAKKGIPVIEDAAQAHAAEYGGKRAGSLGLGGCFSFYPGKNLGAFGDAGAVTSNDEGFITRVRRIANHGGGKNKYDNIVPGTNSRLDTLQAAVLRVKLRHLDQWNAERRERVAAYQRGLSGIPSVITPKERAGSKSVWHLFTIRARNRDELREHLQEKGISTAIHYPKPLHLQSAMSRAGAREGDVPMTERLCGEVLCLPLYSEMSIETVDRVTAEIRAFYESGRRR